MDRTGCHQLNGVLVGTPGCQIGGCTEHTGCHQLNRVLTDERGAATPQGGNHRRWLGGKSEKQSADAILRVDTSLTSQAYIRE
jgi:hypothetical protein